MAYCDVCGNFDRTHVGLGTRIKARDQLSTDLYYYWDAALEEDYDWRDAFPHVDCMCEICFDIANEEKNQLGYSWMSIRL